MKQLPLGAALLALLASPIAAHAARYTYHGELMDGDTPAHGAYDLRLRAFAQPGATRAMAEPTELPGVTVSEGRFSVEVDLPEDADGTTWMEVAVRKAGSGEAYIVLGDPQALAKGSASCPGAWALDGNSSVPAGSFLGPVDPAAVLELKANGRRVALLDSTLDPGFFDAPKVVLGSSANTATGIGATVSGGGATHDGDTNFPEPSPGSRNSASGNFATVAGGNANTASGGRSAIGGGSNNTAAGFWSHVGGGERNQTAGSRAAVGGGGDNSASGPYSTLGGGEQNTVTAEYATVAGGNFNIATGEASTIAGGSFNRAVGVGSMVGGGGSNCAGGSFSWAGGAGASVRTPSGTAANVDCGANSSDGNGDEGTFVWGGTAGITSTGGNQFLVSANGGVGINTATKPDGIAAIDSELTITSNTARPDTNVDIALYPRNSSYGFLVGTQGTQQSDTQFFLTQTDGVANFFTRFLISASGTTLVQGGAVGSLSDARLKKNITPIERPLDTLLALHGHTFEYIDPKASMSAPGPRMGFIAQDVQKILPGWVSPARDGFLGVSTIGFEALAVEAIRDLKTESDLRIEALERDKVDADLRVLALQAELDAVLRRLERLESRQER